MCIFVRMYFNINSKHLNPEGTKAIFTPTANHVGGTEEPLLKDKR